MTAYLFYCFLLIVFAFGPIGYLVFCQGLNAWWFLLSFIVASCGWIEFEKFIRYESLK